MSTTTKTKADTSRRTQPDYKKASSWATFKTCCRECRFCGSCQGEPSISARYCPLNELESGEVCCFGRYCPVTWRPLTKPVAVGFKLFSEHTLLGYDMRDGESDSSIERLPVYKVDVLKTGDIVLAEDSPIVRCLYGPFMPRTDKFFKEYDVTGLNPGAVAFASEVLRSTPLRRMVFAHRPDEKFEISQGKLLPEGMKASDIDAEFMEALQYEGAEVESFFKRKLREEKTKRIRDEPVSMDDGSQFELLLSPSLSNAVPKEVKPVYQANKPIVNFHDNHFLNLGLPENSSLALFALTERPEFWAQIANRRQEFTSVSLHSSKISRKSVFNDWMKDQVLRNIFVAHPTDFKDAYQSQQPHTSVFAVDSQELAGNWIQDFKDDKHDRVYVNFISETQSPGLCAVGPGTMYANPVLTRLLRDHPKSTQVFQGKAVAKRMHSLETTLSNLPVNCFTYNQKPVCELGIVGEGESVWEVGHPEQGDYLGLWIDKRGRVEGVQVVGTKEQRKALLLHEAMLLGCMPKKPLFFADQAQWDMLDRVVTQRLNKAAQRPKNPTVNRR